MGAIANGLIATGFAAAKENGAILVCDVGNWGKPGSLVRPITKGLTFAASASTPGVLASILHNNFIGCLLSRQCVGHIGFPKFSKSSKKTGKGLPKSPVAPYKHGARPLSPRVYDPDFKQGGAQGQAASRKIAKAKGLDGKR